MEESLKDVDARGPITCFLSYVLDPDKQDEFELYATAWIALVVKYGGVHHGYFMPRPEPELAAFSFPGVGRAGPDNIAVALFSFADVEAYQTYRREVAKDPDCVVAEALFRDTNCFLHYERSFMRPLSALSASHAGWPDR